TDAEVARQTLFERTVHLEAVESAVEPVCKAVPECRQPLAFGFHLLAAEGAGQAEADDSRYVESARPQPAFVSAAIHLRNDLCTTAASGDIERPHALRPVELVGRHGKQIDRVSPNIH